MNEKPAEGFGHLLVERSGGIGAHRSTVSGRSSFRRSHTVIALRKIPASDRRPESELSRVLPT